MSDKWEQMAASRPGPTLPKKRRKGYITRKIDAMLREDQDIAFHRLHIELHEMEILDYMTMQTPRDNELLAREEGR